MSPRALQILGMFGLGFVVTLSLLLHAVPRFRGGLSAGERERPTEPLPVDAPKEQLDKPIPFSPSERLGNPRAGAAFTIDTSQEFSLSRVRELAVTDPRIAVEMAEALLLENDDLDARAEIRWLMARCLVALDRFDEAREVARKIVREAPGSPFAHDAERHLLVHPLGLPSREEVLMGRASLPR